MKAKPYEKLSDVYNGLMKNVDYTSWSKYILEIAEDFIEDGDRVLELASGNCKMAELISRKYKNLVCTDISLSMLKLGKNNGIKKICCDMTKLPLKEKYDFVFSAFDSVNYILKQKTLSRLFREVYHILKDDGIFSFDASLERNSLKFLMAKTTQDYYNGFSFTRTNRYNKRSRIHYNSFVIAHNSVSEVNEVHKQKIYDIRTYFKLAEDAGLHIEACYNCFTFNDINSDSGRAQFVMRKIK